MQYTSAFKRCGFATLMSIAITLTACSRGTVKPVSTEEVTTVPQTTTSSISTFTTSATVTSTTNTTTSTLVTSASTTTSTSTTSASTTSQVTSSEITATTTTETEPSVASCNESDVVLLAQLINKEASVNYYGKLMVGSVVLNRANYYGISIADVIYAPNQFTTAYSLGWYSDDDYSAAQEVLSYGSVDTTAFYFTGGYADCLNHFQDFNFNYIGAY